MVYMERSGKTLLFGGESYENGRSVRYGDTWVWDGAEWTDLQVAGPSPRSAASIAYDPVRDIVLLYGGHSSEGRPTDTWQWTGREWQLLSETGPDITDEQPMAFDPDIGRILLFDGRTGRPSKTWVWTGAAWMVIATNGPPVSSYRLVTDTDRRSVVLVATSPYEQVWEWGGRRWTLLSEGSGPGHFYDFASAFDKVRHSVIFHGGAYSGETNDETWEWDGTTWTRLAVDPRVARSSHGMVFDTARERLVVFGGYASSERLDDTWEADADTFLSIVQQPTPRHVIPGEDAGFNVRAVGSGSLAYQWRKDGEPLTDNDRLTGSRKDSLTITNVGPSDEGSYDVVVSRDCGELVSESALLTLHELPLLETGGHCPGRVGVRLTGGGPNALAVLIYGDRTGQWMAWVGPCGYVSVNVGPPHVRVVGWFRATENGTIEVSGYAGQHVCDGYLQFYDLQQCLPSNVVAVP